jgi:hypothetical protein
MDYETYEFVRTNTNSTMAIERNLLALVRKLENRIAEHEEKTNKRLCDLEQVIWFL